MIALPSVMPGLTGKSGNDEPIANIACYGHILYVLVSCVMLATGQDECDSRPTTQDRWYKQMVDITHRLTVNMLVVAVISISCQVGRRPIKLMVWSAVPFSRDARTQPDFKPQSAQSLNDLRPINVQTVRAVD